MAMILLVGAIFPLAALLLPVIGSGPTEEVDGTPLSEFDSTERSAERRYIVEQFRPSFSYTVDEGWPNRYGTGTDLLETWREDRGALTFLNVQEVHDPEDPTVVHAPPNDMAGWLKEHPYLVAGEPKQITVGDVEGVLLDVAVSTPAGHPPSQKCGSPCVPLFRRSDGRTSYLFGENRNRILVLDGIDGERATIIAQSPIEVFGEFLPEATKVLDSVEWGGLPDGYYSAQAIDPRLSLRPGEGWQEVVEMRGYFSLSQEGEASLSFVNVREVYDSEDPGTESVAAPEDAKGLVAWFRDHPHLAVGEPEPITVDGRHGVTFEADVSSVHEELASMCPHPCLPLFRLGDGGQFVFLEGNKNRVTVLEAGGEVVVITVEGPEDRFEAFLPRAKVVLKTLEWER